MVWQREKISYFYDSESSLSMHCLKTRKEYKAKEKKIEVILHFDQFTPPELLKGDKESREVNLVHSKVYFYYLGCAIRPLGKDFIF